METTRPARPGSNGAPETVVTIWDPVAGVIHNLDAANKVSHDMMVHKPGANAQGRPARPGVSTDLAQRRDANNPNVVHETLVGQSVNGVYATGTRATRTIPAGQQGNTQAITTTHEIWTSTDLKVPVMEKESDPMHGTTVRQLANINRAEPDASLFQVPAGYTVKTGGPERGGRRGPGGPGGFRN